MRLYIKNIFRLLILFTSLSVGLEAACSDLQMKDILPTSKDVGDVVDQARMDSGPTAGDYGELIFTRSWHGGGNYRDLNIKLTIYPDNKLAYKEAKKYCKELGSRKIVLPYADIGCTPKMRAYTRRYYKLAKKCAVIELFSSYARSGYVEPQDYILELMTERIDKLNCLCPSGKPPENSNPKCPIIKKLQTTPPIVNRPIKITATVENEENVASSFWTHNLKYKDMFTHVISAKEGKNYITFTFQKPGCVEMTYNILTLNPKCKRVSKKSIKFFVSNNPHVKNHLPIIQKMKQYIAITTYGKFAIVELTFYDADNDTLTIFPTKKHKFYIEKLGKNRFRLNWELEKLPHGDVRVPMEVYDNSCSPTIKTLTINRDTMPVIDYTKNDKKKAIAVDIIQTTNAIENKNICFRANISGVDSKNKTALIYNWNLDGTFLGAMGNSICVKANAGTHKIEVSVNAKEQKGKNSLEFFVSKASTNDTNKKKKTPLIESVTLTTIDGQKSLQFKIHKSLCANIKLLPLSRVHTVSVNWINPKGQSKSMQQFSTKITAATGEHENLQSCFNPQEAGNWSVEVSIDGKLYSSLNFKVVAKSVLSKIKNKFKSAPNSENWAKRWQTKSAAQINDSHDIGWKNVADITTNNPPYGAKDKVFAVPLDKNGAKITFKGSYNVDRKDKSLAIKIASNVGSKFAIDIAIDGVKQFSRVVDGKRWYELTVPLQKYYGKTINVEVILSNIGSKSVAYIDSIGLVNTQHKNRYGFDVNTNRPGATYKTIELTQNNAMLCKRACDKEAQCKAWVFVKQTSTTNPKCQLKSSVTKAVLDPYTVSGVKANNGNTNKTDGYIGCFKDQGDPFGTANRDLNGAIFSKSDMTVKKCINLCKSKGFKYAGLQYSSYCFCGNSYGKYGKANNCNMKCSGNSKENCGGFWANSIYSVNGKGSTKPNTPKNLGNTKKDVIYNSGDSGENFLNNNSNSNLSENDAFKPQRGNIIDLQDGFKLGLNSSIWEVYEWKTLRRLSGNNLVHNGYLDLECNRVDRSAFVATKPIPFKNGEILHIKMRLKVHYANKYYEGGIWFYATDVGKRVRMPSNPNAWLSAFGKNLFNVTHYHYYYEKPGVHPYVPVQNGFAISSMNWRKDRNYGIINPIWDRWFVEDIYYNPAKREAILKIGNQVKKVYTPPYNKYFIRFIIHPYGWYTGHSLQVDWIRISVKKAKNVKIDNTAKTNTSSTGCKPNQYKDGYIDSTKAAKAQKAHYIGCFKDDGDAYSLAGRDLSAYGYHSAYLTPKACIIACKQRGYRYAGLQYSESCVCDNHYGKYGRANNCNLQCKGDKSKICGGAWANSIYDISQVDIKPISYAKMKQHTDLPGPYIKKIELSYPDPNLCKCACESNNRCKSWTYLKPSPLSGDRPICWLRDYVPKAKNAKLYTSGVK